MNWIATMDPQFDFRPVLEQWQLEAANELDFTRESYYESTPSTARPRPHEYIDIRYYDIIQSKSV